MTPLMHPRTEIAVKSALKQRSHGILLTGPEGGGKFFLAKWLGEQLSDEHIVITSEEGKSAISIDQIRKLYSLTRTGNNLTVVVKEAHQMGVEAQNAFLKLLEEPPKNIHFILTSNKTDAILPTIRSRTQIIEVLPLFVAQLETLRNDTLMSDQEFTSAKALTGRLAGSFYRLAHQLEGATDMNVVKEFYTSSAYRRHEICAINNYDKEWAKGLLASITSIIRALLKQQHSTSVNKRLLTQSKLLELTSERLFKLPGNPKIHLAKLCEEL